MIHHRKWMKNNFVDAELKKSEELLKFLMCLDNEIQLQADTRSKADPSTKFHDKKCKSCKKSLPNLEELLLKKIEVKEDIDMQIQANKMELKNTRSEISKFKRRTFLCNARQGTIFQSKRMTYKSSITSLKSLQFEPSGENKCRSTFNTPKKPSNKSGFDKRPSKFRQSQKLISAIVT